MTRKGRKKTKTPAEVREALEEALMKQAWQPALRMALDAERAATRCNRRACRVAGACRMVYVEGSPLACGGGISEAALVMASACVLFGAEMVRAYQEQVAMPERDKAMRDADEFGLPY